MDYCYACRRHLNGAFSCPGCGAPADRLTAAPGGVADTARLPAVGAVGDTADRGPETGGRAARRAERGRGAARRARRGRHRAAVYGVGAIAVVGALTMFSVAALSGGHGGGPPSGSDDGVSVPAPPATSGRLPTTAPGSTGPGGGATRSPSGSGPASPSAGATRPAATRTRTAPVRPPATTRPTATRTATAKPTTAGPTHPPTPTRTPCRPVLWWCG